MQESTHKVPKSASQDMRKIDECNMEKLGTVNNSEKTIAVLSVGDVNRWWPRAAKREICKIKQKVFTCDGGKTCSVPLG